MKTTSRTWCGHAIADGSVRARPGLFHPAGRRQFRETWELLGYIRQSRSPADISNFLLSYAKQCGATYLLAGAIPPPQASKHTQRAHVLLDAWPKEWSERYFSSGYLYRDPTIKLVCRGSASFSWNEVEGLCNVCSTGRRIMDEAREFELCQGHTFSFATIEGGAIGFSFAGRFIDIDPRQRLCLQFAAAFALGCAVALDDDMSSGPPVRLSDRQRDVLLWASEGLKVEAIADRLGISSHTAETHLRMVREKLGATNTIEAVAQALRLGLID